jgi:hypothetical protein
LLHAACPEQGARDARVRDGERHGEVSHRQTRFPGERYEPLDRVKPALIAERLQNLRAAHIGILPAPDASGEHALAKRSPYDGAHAEALERRENLGLDASGEDSVWRLLGVEPLEAAPFGNPLRFDDVGDRSDR